MKKSLSLLFFLSVWPLVSVKAQETKIEKATITFEFPAKDVKGTIGGFSSDSKIDWEHPEKSIFSGTVDVASLDTNIGLRNWSLRGKRYFNAKTYPTISFKSTAVILENNTMTVKGNLTIKGTSKPFTIKFKKNGTTLRGEGSLYSSDFGINIKSEREDNLVNVFFEFDLK